MNTTWLDSGIRQIAYTSISGYQKYLSPHKGFSCAHRILYGGESCSGYIKHIVAQKGLKAALGASRQRFQDCKKAHQILRGMVSNGETDDRENPKKRQPEDLKSQNVCQDAIGNVCGEAIGNVCGEAIAKSCEYAGQSLECGSSLPDCGSCGDCGSGLDCSSLDCGSCGSCGS